MKLGNESIQLRGAQNAQQNSHLFGVTPRARKNQHAHKTSASMKVANPPETGYGKSTRRQEQVVQVEAQHKDPYTIAKLLFGSGLFQDIENYATLHVSRNGLEIPWASCSLHAHSFSASTGPSFFITFRDAPTCYYPVDCIVYTSGQTQTATLYQEKFGFDGMFWSAQDVCTNANLRAEIWEAIMGWSSTKVAVLFLEEDRSHSCCLLCDIFESKKRRATIRTSPNSFPKHCRFDDD